MSADRLIVRDKWLLPESHAARKIGGSTNKERDFNDYAHIVCTVNGRHRDNDADARRLAACWNAFEHVRTEMIESVGTTDSMQAACDALVQLPKALHELAAARALLEEIVSADGDDDLIQSCGNTAAVLTRRADAAMIRIRAFLAGEAA